MSNVTKETLETIERLLEHDAVSVHAAISAAYQLGVFDGGIEVARVGSDVLSACATHSPLREG